MKCRPETTDDREEFIIDLFNDVWGSEGPDWCTQPVWAGSKAVGEK